MNPYIRKGRKYSVEEILPLLKTRRAGEWSPQRIMIDGDPINIRSSRLGTFKNSIVCSCCGIVGKYFVKEKQIIMRKGDGNFFHINLYGVDENGQEVLMTSDHIIPHCKRSCLANNRQTMCHKCNRAKGSREISNIELAMELWIKNEL